MAEACCIACFCITISLVFPWCSSCVPAPHVTLQVYKTCFSSTHKHNSHSCSTRVSQQSPPTLHTQVQSALSESRQICFVICKAEKGCICRRRALEKSDGDDDEGDDLDDDQFDEEEGDNELDGHAASSGIGEASSMLDGVTNREEDAQREVQRQRNLEQALLIQMEMQKKLHEQLEVSLLSLCNQDCRDIARLYCAVTLPCG